MAGSGLPKDWEWCTLGGATGLSTVNPRRPSLTRDSETLTSFLPMQGVDNVEGIIAQLEVRPYHEVRTGYTYFEENDVLFAKITPSMQNGKSAIARGLIDGLGLGSTEFHVLRPITGVLPEWLHLFVRQLSFRQEAMQHFRGAVGQQRVPSEFLESYPIPRPYPDDPARSLETQRRVVGRIEALFRELRAARDLQQKVVEDTGRLMGAVLAETFDANATRKWPNEKTLGNLVEINAPLVDPTLSENRDLPHTHGRVMEEGTGRLFPYRTAAEDGMRSSKYLFRPGSVLYSKIRPYLRKVTILDFEGLCSADMYPLEIKTDEIAPEFLMWALLSPGFTDYANSLSGRARMPKLNRKQLFSYSLRYPGRLIQDSVAHYLLSVRDEIVEMKKTGDKNSTLLDQIEQGILAQAFRGEL